MISKPSGRKAPSQSPNAFYQGKQQGGVRGKAESVPVKLPSPPRREKGL